MKDIFELPEYSPIFLTFTIDQNGIFSVTFDISKTVETLSFYSIPKVQTPFNIEKNAIGIDLGTSRCCVAVIRKNGITTVPLDNLGERLLPSYVSYDEENVKCGKIVVKRLRNHSKSTIFDSKRIIGRSLSDIEIDIFWPFGIFEINSKVCLEVEKFDGKATVIPEEVAAALLKHIKQKAEEFQGKPLSKAVITVPATFNEAQKNATLEAATIAGWKEIILLPEPIAAAFAYFNDRSISNNSNVLLFDLGGGTLDVCIFKIENNQIEIISNTGDSKFGGRDFDTVLINYFKNALSTKYGISFVKQKKYLLMVKCQKIKETLSVIENASLDVDDFDTTQEGNIEISREGFQKMCEILLNKVKNTLNAALHNSNFNANQINKVLHVGGGSRMPMIKELLRNMFPKAEHCIEEHPDEVVAIGAAYYAYVLPSDS
uniref:Heat shock protein 70 n=1 Tax=Panagrolaimus davidi TaxID=227884 RepID=A0A914PJZ3_9BILA